MNDIKEKEQLPIVPLATLKKMGLERKMSQKEHKSVNKIVCNNKQDIQGKQRARSWK
jgi:hypothetical protein